MRNRRVIICSSSPPVTPIATTKVIGNAPADFTWNDSIPSNYIIGQKFCALSTESINGLLVYVTGPSNVRAAIFANNAGAPGVVLAQSGSVACTIGSNRLPLGSTVNLQSGVFYWLMVNCDTDYVVLRSKLGTSSIVYVASAYGAFMDNPAGLGTVANRELQICNWFFL